MSLISHEWCTGSRVGSLIAGHPLQWFGLFYLLVVCCQGRRIRITWGTNHVPAVWDQLWQGLLARSLGCLPKILFRLPLCKKESELIFLTGYWWVHTNVQIYLLSCQCPFVSATHSPHFCPCLTWERLTHPEKTDSHMCCCIWSSHFHIEWNCKIFLTIHVTLDHVYGNH